MTLLIFQADFTVDNFFIEQNVKDTPLDSLRDDLGIYLKVGILLNNVVFVLVSFNISITYCYDCDFLVLHYFLASVPNRYLFKRNYLMNFRRILSDFKHHSVAFLLSIFIFL